MTTTTALTTIEKLTVGADACTKIAGDLPAALGAMLETFAGGIELQIAFPSKETAMESEHLTRLFADRAAALGMADVVAPILPLMNNLCALSTVRVLAIAA